MASGTRLWTLTLKTIESSEGVSSATPLELGSQRPATDLSALPAMILSALAGGLILNLMPCVLPVIGLKIFSFVEQAGESRRNENVQFNLIDNNALKELNVRLGSSATVTPAFEPEFRYFGTEFGNKPSGMMRAY